MVREGILSPAESGKFIIKHSIHVKIIEGGNERLINEICHPRRVHQARAGMPRAEPAVRTRSSSGSLRESLKKPRRCRRSRGTLPRPHRRLPGGGLQILRLRVRGRHSRALVLHQLSVLQAMCLAHCHLRLELERQRDPRLAGLAAQRWIWQPAHGMGGRGHTAGLCRQLPRRWSRRTRPHAVRARLTPPHSPTTVHDLFKPKDQHWADIASNTEGIELLGYQRYGTVQGPRIGKERINGSILKDNDPFVNKHAPVSRAKSAASQQPLSFEHRFNLDRQVLHHEEEWPEEDSTVDIESLSEPTLKKLQPLLWLELTALFDRHSLPFHKRKPPKKKRKEGML